MPAVPRCRLNGGAGLAAERSSVWTSYVAGAVQASLHLIWTLTALPALHQPEPPYPDQSRSVKWFPPRVQLVIVCQEEHSPTLTACLAYADLTSLTLPDVQLLPPSNELHATVAPPLLFQK